MLHVSVATVLYNIATRNNNIVSSRLGNYIMQCNNIMHHVYNSYCMYYDNMRTLFLFFLARIEQERKEKVNRREDWITEVKQ